jgi:hypothetical protein
MRRTVTKIVTNTEKELDKQLTIAVEALKKVETVRSKWQARMLAQQALDQLQSEAGLDEEPA